jgi:hypothetical protein
MRQTRIERKKPRAAATRSRRERTLLLLPDPRDPEVVRAKRLRRKPAA